MRIGVITFWQTQDNYGQVLQCYALQRVLYELGHQPYVIRYGFHEKSYACSLDEKLAAKLHVFRLYSDFKKRISLLFLKRNNVERHFDIFRNRYIHFSFRFYNSYQELTSKYPKADVYITGSDQVWAQLLSYNDNKAFFLDFGKNETKRIAYAPSFALKKYPEELNCFLAEELKRISAISVRENTGVAICSKVGYKAVEVLDPTLLLKNENYTRLAKAPKCIDYVFVYHVNIGTPEELFWDDFHSYNVLHNWESLATFANPIAGKNMEFLLGAHYLYPSIEEWLGLIKNAKYILTSSFHGVVFSLLFHKPFIVCLRKESKFAGNDRVTSLLSKLGLESRVYVNGVGIDNFLDEVIDWDSVDEKLSLLRLNSMDFLIGNLK